MKKKLFFTLLSFLSLSAIAQVYDEGTDGDLSNDFMNPTLISFDMVEGRSEVTSSQLGMPRDVDYFTFTVPDGYVLTDIFVREHQVDDPANKSFIGIQRGSSFTKDANSTMASDLLGGTVFGAEDEEFSILNRMGFLEGAEGYTSILTEGTYTIWLNQTGGFSSQRLDLFIEPEFFEFFFLWEEETNSELSGDHMKPTGTFTLFEGENIFTTVQEGIDGANNRDYFTFEVPNGMQLSEIIVDLYDADDVDNNNAFIGIIAGNSFPNDSANTPAGDLLGGKVYGFDDEGLDILQDMGQLAGAEGFTGPLPAGVYSIWLNQTGELNFSDLVLVTEPSPLSTNEFDLKNTTNVFPNPASNNISISSANNTINSYTITDVSGRTVIPLKQVSSLNTSLDISALNSGLYFVNIETDKGSFSKKIIKK